MAAKASNPPVSAYIAYQQLKQQMQKDAPEPSSVVAAAQPSTVSNADNSNANGISRQSGKKRQRNGTKAKLDDTINSSKKTKLANVAEEQRRPNQASAAKPSPTVSTVSSNRQGRNAKKRLKKQLQKSRDQKPAKTVKVVADKKREGEKKKDNDNEDEDDDSEENYGGDAPVINPLVEATEVFKEMIDPISVEQFFSTYWERKPLLLKRRSPEHFADWLSTEDLDLMLRNQRVMFGEHLDVTSYRDGKRETHNPEGRALASQVWQFYQSGCSLRLLCPQVFHERVYQKLSILHELFGAFVGANVYLTPPGTQGFAPHWDDIEAFVMQLEGRKHWRVYAPRCPAERLPRESSGNFGPKDRLGQPVIDAVLEPGDLLYMPRGFIHQGRCLEGWHSLHITVSTYQKFSWSDLLSEALANALERAAREDVEFRRGLPLGLLGFAGSAFASADKAGGFGGQERAARRRQAEEMCRSLLTRLATHVSLDDAADKLACQQVRDALPPALDPSEAARSAYGAGPVWNARRCRATPPPTATKPGVADGAAPLQPLTGATRVRLIRRSAARLLARAGQLHTSLGNTRVFREAEPAFLEVDSPLAAGVAALAAAYPDFLAVRQLPIADPEERLGLATSLYDSGLLVTEDLL